MGLFDRFLKPQGKPAGDRESVPVSNRQEATHMLEEGMALEQRGQLDEALKHYEAAIRLMPELARAHFNRGNILLDRGDAASALDAYAKAVVYKPDSAAVHYNMGNAQLRLGHAEAAIAACREAIALKPDFADAHVTLGMALEKLGQHQDAVACYQRAAEIKPESAEAYNNQALALMEISRYKEAIVSFDMALALKPDYTEAHNNRGIAFQNLGQFDQAIFSYRQALAIDSRRAEVHTNLGSALKELGELDAAMASYGRALEINPALTETHHNLGVAFQKQGQLDHATACYQRALRIQPDHVPAINGLGAALGELGQYEKALAYFRRAIEIQPDSADGHLNLGITLRTVGQLDAAKASFQRALEIHPDNPDTHVGLSNVLKDFGEFESSLKSVRRALEIKPDCVLAHNNLLFIHNYVADQPAALLLADARRFGAMATRLARPWTDWPNSPNPERRLRVGFVSGDLCDHPVGYFLVGVLAALSSQASDRLELFAYPNRAYDDVTSKRLRANCKGWHPAVGLSDEALARRIRDDGIDILIDLSGHTAHNRLAVFAWKPAPVQLAWLGYLATTGLAAMDYILADAWTLPAVEELHFTEKVWRLPESYLCFTPPDHDVMPAALPAISNGYITFGSCNNLTKMTDDVVALWSRVLAAVPDSRLILKSMQLHEAVTQRNVIDRFAVHGIEAKRLILKALVPRSEYLMTYQEMDIALDPFPYPGITTSVESLWMGVPVLTLAGERFLSRQGVGLLMNAGLPEWVASDPRDYVARAVAHASDLHGLASLRSGLRQQVLASPIFDAPRFAQHFETALRAMWLRWCDAQPAANRAADPFSP